MTTIANEIPFFMSVLLDRLDYALRTAAMTPCLPGPSHGPVEAGHYVPRLPVRLWPDRAITLDSHAVIIGNLPFTN